MAVIKSPCKGICKNNSDGLCIGCFRTKSERENWSLMTDQEKRLTLGLCKSRERKAAA